MAKNEALDNGKLLKAGQELMQANGKSLTKKPSPGRSMIYALADGSSVRVRTSWDHVLVVMANQPSPKDAKLNIEGTDWLLLIMAEVERVPGKVIAYLVPTAEAVEAVRAEQQAWLDTHPSSKGNNLTWLLYFGAGTPAYATDYAQKWAHYRLQGKADATAAAETGDLKTEVEAARQRISKVAGVPPSAVRITVEFAL